jgi:tight adherence protein B
VSGLDPVVAVVAGWLGGLWAARRAVELRRVERVLSAAPGRRAARGRRSRPDARRPARRIADEVARRSPRRAAAIEEQLPEALAEQVAALRSGHSLGSSLAVVASRLGLPLGGPGGELTRCAAETALGVPLDEVLGGLEERCGTAAVRPWIATLLAARTTGGDVTPALRSVAARARSRAQLRSEHRALTAQGRLSAAVVSLAPIGLVALLAATPGDQVGTLYGDATVLPALVAGAVLEAAGLVWVRRIVRGRP